MHPRIHESSLPLHINVFFELGTFHHPHHKSVKPAPLRTGHLVSPPPDETQPNHLFVSPSPYRTQTLHHYPPIPKTSKFNSYRSTDNLGFTACQTRGRDRLRGSFVGRHQPTDDAEQATASSLREDDIVIITLRSARRCRHCLYSPFRNGATTGATAGTALQVQGWQNARRRFLLSRKGMRAYRHREVLCRQSDQQEADVWQRTHGMSYCMP